VAHQALTLGQRRLFQEGVFPKRMKNSIKHSLKDMVLHMLLFSRSDLC
jgi:hypothetical protein